MIETGRLDISVFLHFLVWWNKPSKNDLVVVQKRKGVMVIEAKEF
jgi:hypothetical protein